MLAIALDLITSRNIDEVGVVLPDAIFPLQLTCDLCVVTLYMGMLACRAASAARHHGMTVGCGTDSELLR